MRLIELSPEQIVVSPDLVRSRVPKQFAERLRASIAAIGLAEPIKVAKLPQGQKYLIVDGAIRWRCILALREQDPSQFMTVPAYEVSHEKRYEVRFQTDIYQDLLPSQLAVLVEHLHQAEQISKIAIAQYIGVSAPTVRNYTGLWRLLERGGLFASLVHLMDLGVVPSSNPYAWLRLTPNGARRAIETLAAANQTAEEWVIDREQAARRGEVRALPLKVVETITSDLPPDCYREDEAVRALKRDLGLRRGKPNAGGTSDTDEIDRAVRNLDRVRRRSADPVLKSAAESLKSQVG